MVGAGTGTAMLTVCTLSPGCHPLHPRPSSSLRQHGHPGTAAIPPPVPQSHVKIPAQGSPHSSPADLLVRDRSLPGDMPFLRGAGSGPLLGTASLAGGSGLDFCSWFVTCLALHSPWSLTQVSLDFALGERWLWDSAERRQGSDKGQCGPARANTNSPTSIPATAKATQGHRCHRLPPRPLAGPKPWAPARWCGEATCQPRTDLPPDATHMAAVLCPCCPGLPHP